MGIICHSLFVSLLIGTQKLFVYKKLFHFPLYFVNMVYNLVYDKLLACITIIHFRQYFVNIMVHNLDDSSNQFHTEICLFNKVYKTNSLISIHTLRVHYAHAAANLNSGYSKYAKVARVHYFCTIALRISRAVLTRAWASRRVDLFSKRVIIFCW